MKSSMNHLAAEEIYVSLLTDISHKHLQNSMTQECVTLVSQFCFIMKRCGEIRLTDVFCLQVVWILQRSSQKGMTQHFYVSNLMAIFAWKFEKMFGARRMSLEFYCDFMSKFRNMFGARQCQIQILFDVALNFRKIFGAM